MYLYPAPSPATPALHIAEVAEITIYFSRPNLAFHASFLVVMAAGLVAPRSSLRPDPRKALMLCCFVLGPATQRFVRIASHL